MLESATFVADGAGTVADSPVHAQAIARSLAPIGVGAGIGTGVGGTGAGDGAGVVTAGEGASVVVAFAFSSFFS